MLADRSYMRDTEYRPGFSGAVKLLIALVVVFVLQQIDLVYNGGKVFWHLAFSKSDVLQGMVWQFVTYQFLHGSSLHLLFNGLAVWLFGRAVESTFGTARMYTIFFLCGVVGGLFQLLLSFLIPAWGVRGMVGASAGTSGLLAVFCLVNPQGTILLYFVPVAARVVLMISLGLSLFLSFVPSETCVAHPAHLGGLLAGMGMMRWGIPEFSMGWWDSLKTRFRSRHLKVVPKGGSSSWESESSRPRQAGEEDEEEYMRKVVNPILDKISVHGTHSLTAEEKRILNAASARMKKS